MPILQSARAALPPEPTARRCGQTGRVAYSFELPSPRPRPDEASASPVGGDRLDGVRARRLRRPRRRGHAEADDEIEVQPDQREDRARDQEHVDRVETRQRLRADLSTALEERADEGP